MKIADETIDSYVNHLLGLDDPDARMQTMIIAAADPASLSPLQA